MSKPDEETRRLAEATEKQLQLPPGLVSRFLENGGQLDKQAQATVLDAYGIDPKLNKRNAVDAVGLALQDAMQRNGNDPTIAVAELHGGRDRNRWSKGTNDFAVRVVTEPARAVTAPAGRRSVSGMKLQQQAGRRGGGGLAAPPPVQSPPVVGETPADPAEADAQMSMMPDEEVAAVEARNAPPAAPVGAPPAGEMEAPAPLPAGAIKAAGPKTLEAYRNGTLEPAKRLKFEELVKSGALAVPADFQIGAPPPSAPTQAPADEPSLFERAKALPGVIKEQFTGEQRTTPEIEALPDWMTAPSTGKLKSIGQDYAFVTAPPEEAIQILQANIPGVTVRRDPKGNIIFRDPEDGKEYGVKPGFRLTDTPRVVANAVPFIAANLVTGGLAGSLGAVGSTALAAGTSMATQGAIEANQASSGGEFNATDVLLAGALEPVAPLAGAAIGAGSRALGRVANAALDQVPGSTTRQVAGAVADAAAQGVDDATRVVSPPTAVPAAAAGDVAGASARAVDQTATQAIPGIAPAAKAAPLTEEALGDMLKKAVSNGKDAAKAKADLAQALNIDKDLAKRAEELGFDLPADVLSDSRIIKETVGGLRSKVGSDAAQDFAANVARNVDAADANMAKLGAEASPDAVSRRVFKELDSARADFDAQADRLYKSVDAVVPRETPAVLDNVARVLDDRLKTLGGDAAKLTPKERQLLKLVEGTRDGAQFPTTYQSIYDEKEMIRLAKRGLGDYATAGDVRNDRLYRALVEDQRATVARAGGDASGDLVAKLDLANQLTAKQKAIEEKIVSYFGDKDGNGSIASLMEGAIRGAKKGDQTKLIELLDEVVPKNLHSDVLMTAIAGSTQAKGGAFKGQFGFAEMDDFYRNLRKPGNEAVYKRVATALGPQRAETLRALAEISRRLTEARALQLTTGKANQIPKALQFVGALSLVQRIMQSNPGKAAGVAAGGLIGNAILPGVGAAAGGAGALSMMQFLAKGGKEAVEAAGKLLISPELKALTLESMQSAADSPAIKEAVRKVVTTKPWRDWAKAANMSRDPKVGERFLLAALQSGKGQRE